MRDIDYSRPLDVHRFSDYPEVDEWVDAIWNENLVTYFQDSHDKRGPKSKAKPKSSPEKVDAGEEDEFNKQDARGRPPKDIPKYTADMVKQFNGAGKMSIFFSPLQDGQAAIATWRALTPWCGKRTRRFLLRMWMPLLNECELMCSRFACRFECIAHCVVLAAV